MIYPFCVAGDVSAKNQSRTYDANSNPSSTELAEFIDTIASKLRNICNAAGYDLDNIAGVSSTVALEIAAGSDKEVVVADGTGFTEGQRIMITGLEADIRKVEFDYLTAVSGTTLTIKTVDETYQAVTATIAVINDALQELRDLNAIGAAAMAEDAAFAGMAPNRSEHAETLWEQFWGNEEHGNGVWAIRNIPDYLYGATTTDDMPSDDTATSFHVENPSDKAVQAGAEFDLLTKW